MLRDYFHYLIWPKVQLETTNLHLSSKNCRHTWNPHKNERHVRTCINSNSGTRRLPRPVRAKGETVIPGGLLFTIIRLVKRLGHRRLILGQNKELCDELEVIVFYSCIFIQSHQEVQNHSSLVAFYAKLFVFMRQRNTSAELLLCI